LTHPLYLHARALSDLGLALSSHIEFCYGDLIQEGRVPLHFEIAEAMKADVCLIRKGAAAVTRERSLKKSNSTLKFLRILSRNLLSYCNGLEHHGLKEREYVHLLRKEIRLYRRALRTWALSLN